jgi:hypothetical protein
MGYIGTKPSNAALTSEQIADGAVGTVDIADNAVVASKIANSSVTANKLGSDVGLLGVGQTYQAFTVGATRVNGTTYTNSTGKPIVVQGYFNVSASTSITVGGVSVPTIATNAQAYIPFFFVVPNGVTYSVTGATLWAELR